ncbi:MAG TPA: AAA family ATPase, partial [Longimicrobiaceae bacterium]|nr:AAA family ATPase [Longimicrobiaceae bacterium]
MLDLFRPGAPPRMLALLDGMHASDPDRWIPRRLVLQNYWLFEEPEVFHFARGNLMLTGQNESGKSTVLVTAITLVLDMVLTPDRVDTMGSNDRSIRYYLVGKDDAPEDSPYHYRERTAYIALEFERGSSGRFHTIGIGLRCSREWANQKVDRWGFLIDDGRRVEIDFHLHDGGEPKRPFREGELRDRIGRGGRVLREQREYKKAVNKALFGFGSVEEYERFLDILHVVRTPKLGEGLSPRKVEGYLKDSLPPIQTTAIEGASEVFSKLDTIEAELDRLDKQLRTAAELEEPQEAAAFATMCQDAVAYREAAREHRGRQRALEKLETELQGHEAMVGRQENIREALSAERAKKQGRADGLREVLRSHEAFDLEKQLRGKRGEHGEAASAHGELIRDRRAHRVSLEREEKDVREAEEAWDRMRRKVGERLSALVAASERAFWPSLEHRAKLAGDALEGMDVAGSGSIASDLARSSVEAEAGERRAGVAGVLSALDALADAGRQHEEARRASDVARREYNRSDERYRSTLRDTAVARATAGDALRAWRTGCGEMPVADDAMDAVLTAVDTYDPQGSRPGQVLDSLRTAYEAAAQLLRMRREELGFVRTHLRGEEKEAGERLRRLAAEEDVEPDRSPSREAARRLLREHGVPHLPLFAACDLAGPLAENAGLAARVEAALLDAGLLDALVVPAAEAGRVRTLLEAHGLGDRWIQPAAEGPEALAADGWLAPVSLPDLSPADVRAALRALGLAGGTKLLDTAGGWRLGPLEGLVETPSDARVRFLGESNRREERRRRIEEARIRLAETRVRLTEVEEEIGVVEGRERTLAGEWRAAQELPELQVVHDHALAVRREAEERERRRQAAEMAAEAVESAARVVQQKTATLDRATGIAPYLQRRSRAEVEAVAHALEEAVRLTQAVGEDVERLEEIRRTRADRMRSVAALR